jgi:hypothetical protein
MKKRDLQKPGVSDEHDIRYSDIYSNSPTISHNIVKNKQEQSVYHYSDSDDSVDYTST